MTSDKPYRVLISPIGPLTSEKVLNAKEKLDPNYARDYRVASRKAMKELTDEIRGDEALTAEQKQEKVAKERRKLLHGRHATRRVMNQNQNKVVFKVRDDATKPQIKRAIEQIYHVKVVKVNTVHTKRGKRAIIKLSESDSAEEVYNRLGQM